MRKLKTLEELPESIDVRVLRNRKTGIWIGEIKNLDVFTEADNLMQLIYNINDLIYAFFDIPKEEQHNVWYMPPYYQSIITQQPKIQLDKLMKFNILISPQLHHKYFN